MFEGMFNSMLKPMLLKLDTPELKDVRDVFVEAVDEELMKRDESTATSAPDTV